MAYRALFGPAGPPTLGAIAPVATVDAALTAQGANAAEVKEWHTIEAACNSQVVRRRYVGNATNATNCQLTDGFLPRQDANKPYRRLALGGRHQHINAHVAAYMVHNLVVQPPAGWQVSHRCHVGSCVNPAHLTLEMAAANRARNICQGWTHIACPCGCNHRFNPCRHVPQCVLPP